MNKNSYSPILQISSLSKHLKNKIKKDSNRELTFWLPSKINIVIILTSFILIFLIESLIKNVDKPFINQSVACFYKYINLSKSDLLINIHTGIWAVVIGLVFFVAQSLSDSNEPDKGRVLLKESFFFPLLIGELLISVSFLIKGFFISKFLLSLCLSGVTIISLYRTINVLLKDYEFNKSKKEMLMKIIKHHYIKLATRDFKRRISDNILLEGTKLLPNFSYNPFETKQSNSILILAGTEGEIHDISIIKLKSFSDKLNKLFEDSLPNRTLNENEYSENPLFECTLLASMYNKIDLTSKLFIITPKIKLSKYQITEIKTLFILAQKVFTIKDYQNSQEKARYEISKIQKKCLNAITNDNFLDVRDSTDFYLALINELYKFHKKLNIRYDEKRANQEAQSFLDSLNQLDWLVSDIRSIYKAGILSENSEINLAVMYLPIRIARNAVVNKDHLFFKSFIQFQFTLYHYYLQKDKKSILIFDRVHRHLTETANFYLISLIRKSKMSIDEFYAYTNEIFLQFNNLLKASVDYKELNEFKVFIKKLHGLYNYIDLSSFNYTEKDEITSNIQSKKNELTFGIASWVNHELNKKKKIKLLKKFYTEIESYLPNDLNGLNTIFLKCTRDNINRFWCWDDWALMEKGEDSGAHFYDPNEILNQLYIKHSLKLLNEISDTGQLKNYLIPLDKDAKYEFQESGKLWQLLQLTKQASINTKNIEKLEKLFKDSLELQNNKEVEELRKSIVNHNVISEFIKGIVDDYKRHSDFSNIFKRYDLIEYNSQEYNYDEVENFGIVTNVTKTYFLQEHIHNSRSFGFGSNLANSESNVILNELNQKCNKINREQFEVYIQSSLNNNHIIITNRNTIWKYFQTEEFSKIAVYEKNNVDTKSNEDGYLLINNLKIPVFYVVSESKYFVLILNKNKFGKFIKLKPKPVLNFNSTNLQDESISINVIDYTSNKGFLNEVLQNPNEFLKSKGNQEDQRNYLLEMVYVNVSERFKLELCNDFEGFSYTQKEN